MIEILFPPEVRGLLIVACALMGMFILFVVCD
jgi:hypothetical protein